MPERENELASRDLALPGLATVLNPSTLQSAAQQVWPHIAIADTRIVYIRYKPGRRCLVACECLVAGAPATFYAKALTRRGHSKRASHYASGRSQEVPLMPAGLEEQAITFHPFPHDEKVEAVRRLYTSPRRDQLLHRLFPEWTPTELHLNALAYKPERRFAGAVSRNNYPCAAIKCYVGTEFSRATLNAQALRSGQHLRLAPLLAKSRRHRILALGWIDGQPLAQFMTSRPATEPFYRVGQALAELHAQDCGRLRQISPRSEALELKRLASDLSFLAPELGERIRHVASQIADGVSDLPQMRRPIHGDFHIRQLIAGDHWIGLLDLDEAACGDPMSDIANFWAHLERDRLRHKVDSQAVEDVQASLICGYSHAGAERSGSSLAQRKATSLLKLMPHAFRDNEPNWPAMMEQMLIRVEEVAPPKRESRCTVGYQVASVLPSTDVAVLRADGLRNDPSMHFLRDALDPECVARHFSSRLRHLAAGGRSWRLQKIDVVRHKHGRRCLIQYDLQEDSSAKSGNCISLLGKVRSYGLDKRAFRLQKQLWHGKFGRNVADGICVPRPVAAIPSWYMWLQVKVPGRSLDETGLDNGGEKLGRRIVDAIYKLHSSQVVTSRRHTVIDEFGIVQPLLADCRINEPHFAPRIDALSKACEQLVSRLKPIAECGIHRDFYQDHVISDQRKLYLVDLDLFSLGDPALDLGNFLAHLIELSLRTVGHPDRFCDIQQSMLRRARRLYGRSTARRIEPFVTLSLSRHVAISRKFPDRRHITETLLHICETRLALPILKS